ncbi:transcriptional regulator [Mesorhizobium sp. LNHC232B00]|nr:transcriptional regulator [Mesorhizobium sp. LNHC232B00]
MPISSMKAYAERNDMPAFVELTHSPTVGFDDPVIRHLGAAAVAAFDRPAMTGDLLIDTILDAACFSVMGRYGTSRRATRPRSCGLAPWQERRAKELIDTCLDVSLAQLAQECGLSVEHFGRAFKRSTGMAPHQWQLERRTRRAKTLLADSVHSIAEIALACGFSSQSHFSTAFRQNAGVSPGHWRRLQALGSGSNTI